MYPGSERLSYLCYRCHRCKRLLTKLEILDKWSEYEAELKANPGLTSTKSALCVCGSRHIVPTNPLWWEELLYPRVWRLWWHEVILPWWRR
jgi:hypothetical protein